MGNKKGFTLLQLMIVIVIIGVTAAITIPKYIDAVNKEMCGDVLKEIYDAQTAYHQEHGAYTESKDDLTLSLRGRSLLKDHKMTVIVYLTSAPSFNDSFKAVAVRGRMRGTIDVTGKIWWTTVVE